MATTSPARIEDDLYASAKLVGEVLSRSASQQIAHWARIGREIQASASISHREIAEVLAGRASYDGLGPKEQAVVRAEWLERMAAYREELDLLERFQADGRSWVELDDDGRVVERNPSVLRSASQSRRESAKPPSRSAARRGATATKQSPRSRSTT